MATPLGDSRNALTILDQHLRHLPPPSSINVQAFDGQPRVYLLTDTAEDVVKWADALDLEADVSEHEDGRVHTCVSAEVYGVPLRVAHLTDEPADE